MVTILVPGDGLKSGINIGLLFLLLIVALFYRRPLFFYNTHAKMATLILKQGPPIKYIRNVVNNPYLLNKEGFLRFVETNEFVIFYKHSQLPEFKFKKTYLLEIGIVIKNYTKNFYEQDIDEEIKKIENLFTKKERPAKYIITGYKNYKSANGKMKEELAENVCYTIKKFHYVQINVGFVEKEKLAYLLYSPNFNPSTYYKRGLDFINSLIVGKDRLNITT